MYGWLDMRSFLVLISVIGDYVFLILSLLLVVFVRTREELFYFVVKEYAIVFVPLFLVWLFVFYLFDLYNFDTPPRFSKFFFCLCITGTLSILFFYLFPHLFDISPKTNLALLIVVYALVYYLWRGFIEIIFVKLFHGHEIMMAISDSDSLYLATLLDKNQRYKYSIQGVLVTKELEEEARKQFSQEIVFTDSHEFNMSVDEKQIKTVVATSLWFTRLYGKIYELLPMGVRIINSIKFHEMILGYIPVHSTSQHWIMNNFDMVSRRMYMGVKRLLDIVFAICILPFALICMLGVVVLLKMFGEKKAPALFSQARVGLYNQEFTLYKFRSMVMNAELNGAQWASEKDPRVTKIGRFLRLTRLDELPQIFNILKGNMSFIGPRPERMEFVKELLKDIPHYQIRHIIKPGLSGWAQVKFRYGNTVEDATVKLCYDLYYIKNINFILDARIFFRTIVTVLTAAGQ